MIIIEGHYPIPEIPNAIVTSGTFDGVHFGHKRILNKIVKIARELSGKSVVLTFWPHPRFVLCPNEKKLKLLTTFEEKASLLEDVGIDYLVKIKFTKQFSKLSSEHFIQTMIVEKLKARKLVIGYDHRFGKNRSGSFEYLKENSRRFAFELEEIPRQDIDNVGISSTKIRQALFHGEVHLATEYLGREYAISGVIVRGEKIGTQLGYPTANVLIEKEYKLIPKDGVYAVLATIRKKTYKAMLNIGVRPTVDGLNKVIEAHLFDFNEQIYNETMQIKFVRYLRAEKKFDSSDDLKTQLGKDKANSISILSHF